MLTSNWRLHHTTLKQWFADCVPLLTLKIMVAYSNGHTTLLIVWIFSCESNLLPIENNKFCVQMLLATFLVMPFWPTFFNKYGTVYGHNLKHFWRNSITTKKRSIAYRAFLLSFFLIWWRRPHSKLYRLDPVYSASGLRTSTNSWTQICI